VHVRPEGFDLLGVHGCSSIQALIVHSIEQSIQPGGLFAGQAHA
jgi:hypothetical protein